MNCDWIEAINSLPRTNKGIEDLALQYECWFIQCIVGKTYLEIVWRTSK